MTPCDCCGTRVDERSLSAVYMEQNGVEVVVGDACHVCLMRYDDAELAEKILERKAVA